MSEPIQEDGAGLLWVGIAGGLLLTAGAVALSLRPDSKADARDGEMPKARTNILGPVWPIALNRLRRVGDTVMAKRPGTGRPHNGVDLFADADTPVVSAVYGTVLRVVDGRKADRVKQESLWRAGLFIDVRALNGWIYRYLHLGSYAVEPGQPVRAGLDVLGTVSPAGQSGVEHSDPHIHFEIRQGWDRETREYGEPLDPLKILPPRRKVA